MTMKWLENFIDNLTGILEKPPYLVFVYIGAIFVIISLVTKNFFEQTWIFFLYAVVGSIWRYIEKDFIGTIDRASKKEANDQENNRKMARMKLKMIAMYHIGNLGLVIALLHYLKLV